MENNRTLEQSIQNLQTPCYICEEQLLENNLKLLKKVKEKSGAKILLALKGFAFSPLMPMVMKYLDGCCASGLYEAKYANDFKAKEIHTYSAAFEESQFDEICELSHHIVFNSINQYKTLMHKTLNKNSLGLRINPEVSTVSHDIYNPCAINSRLGITKQNLQKAIKEDDSLFNNIEGLHFHALCEQDSSDLEIVWQKFNEDFSQYFNKLKWLNLGGGHHITKNNYDINLLVKIIKNIKKQYPHLDIYLEPGEAIGWKTGPLVASVLDIVNNGIDIAMLDTSAEAHMSDTIIMPYKADVRHTNDAYEHKYILAGNTCLAGDIMGTYNFKNKLQIGDKIIFEDMIHYTIVKNTTFNGIKLPNLAVFSKDCELRIKKEFGYLDYKNRN